VNDTRDVSNQIYHQALRAVYDNGIYKSDENGGSGIPDIESISGVDITQIDRKNHNEDNNHDGLAILLNQANEKPETLTKILQSANRVNLPNTEIEEEKIMKMWSGTLNLKNFKFRSNLSMRGKFILTNRRLIGYRKKFGFFPQIPFIAYVRPNNRMIFLSLRILSVMSRLRIILTSVIRAVGFPVIFGLLLTFRSLRGFFDGVNFPSLPAVTKPVNYMIENPQLIAGLGGSLGGLSYVGIKFIRFLFYRSRSVVVLPFPMLRDIESYPKNPRLAQLICKPKGSDSLPGLQVGLPFRLFTRSHSLPNIPEEITDQSIILSLAMQSIIASN
jgi:hypothetical protein